MIHQEFEKLIETEKVLSALFRKMQPILKPDLEV